MVAPEGAVQAGGAYFLVLSVVYGIISTVLVPKNFPRMSHLDKNDIHGVHGRVLSALHCLVSSLGAAWVLSSSWTGFPYFFDGNPNNSSPGSETLVAFEISELIFTLIMNIYYGEDLFIHVHHIAGLAAELPCIYFGQGLHILMWVHLAQFTQPFLYGSWICYKLKMTSGLIFPFCSAAALLLWFIIRVIITSFPVLWAVYDTRALYKSGAQSVIMLLTQSIFMGLNFMWFKALVVKALGTFGGGKSKSKKQK